VYKRQSDDTTHTFYSNFLDDLGRYEDSYDEHVAAINYDPTDGTRFFNLGVHIMRRGYLKRSDGVFVGPIPKKEREQAAFPFLQYALTDRFRNSLIRQRLINFLVQYDRLAEAEIIEKGGGLSGEFDTAILEHILKECNVYA
jgi:hypothetical protein